jgi:hypothetical protein
MPEPETADAVPAVQSPVVGAVETWTAVAGPHWLEARLSAQTVDEMSRKIETDIIPIRQVVRDFWRSSAFIWTMLVHDDHSRPGKQWVLFRSGVGAW